MEDYQDEVEQLVIEQRKVKNDINDRLALQRPKIEAAKEEIKKRISNLREQFVSGQIDEKKYLREKQACEQALSRLNNTPKH